MCSKNIKWLLDTRLQANQNQWCTSSHICQFLKLSPNINFWPSKKGTIMTIVSFDQLAYINCQRANYFNCPRRQSPTKILNCHGAIFRCPHLIARGQPSTTLIARRQSSTEQSTGQSSTEITNDSQFLISPSAACLIAFQCIRARQVLGKC